MNNIGKINTENIKIVDNQLVEMEAALEIESDKLLEEAGYIVRSRGVRRNNDSGCYMEKQLSRRARAHEIDPDPLFWQMVKAETEMTDFILADIEKLCKLAGFSDTDQTIWELHIMGLAYADIAESIGVSRQAIHKKIRKLHAGFLDAMLKNPYFGWYEVYLEEIHRN